MKNTTMTTHQNIKAPNIVEVTRKKMRTGPAPSTVKKRAEKILTELHCNGCELSVVLCNDEFIHGLNKEFRDKDTPTDVLSFPLNDEPQNATRDSLLGDVVISIDTAKKQAAAQSHSLLLEVTTLLIHGILHLLGHTHDNDADEAKMNQVAASLLKKM